jgi:hypothetical protein
LASSLGLGVPDEGLPPPKQADLAFKMPPLTDAEREAWQAKVWKAIAETKLVLTHLGDTLWTVAGACPHCEDEMSNIVDTKVVTSDSVMNVRTFGADDLKGFTTEIVCTCKVDPAHLKDVAGCGYGAGLLIHLPFPE